MESWGENSSDGAPSVLLRLIPSAGASCLRVSSMGASTGSRYGTTCARSTGSRGGGGVDVVSGGFPCKDIAVCGRGEGISGPKSGLWVEMARIVREVRPRFVFVENSPALTSRGLGVVLGDLAEMGFDARWGVIGAHHAGAPHKRDRIWVLAHADSERLSQHVRESGDACTQQPPAFGDGRPVDFPPAQSDVAGWHRWRGAGGPEPGVCRDASWMADRAHRLRAIGNGQVPCVAALAWRVLGGP